MLAKVKYFAGLSHPLLYRAVVTVAVAVDQGTKAWARASLITCDEPPVELCHRVDLGGQVALIQIDNAGGALGFGEGLAI